MLDPWIIEEIRRREEEERSRQEQQPVVEMPLDVPAYPGPGQGHRPPDKDEERGVVILDFSV